MKSPATELVDTLTDDGFRNTVSRTFNKEVSGVLVSIWVERYSRHAAKTYAGYCRDVLRPLARIQDIETVAARALKRHRGAFETTGNLVLHGHDLTMTIQSL